MSAIQRPIHATNKLPVDRHNFDAVMVPTYAPSSVVPVHAAGLDVWDQSGKQYFDFTTGIAVTSLGHAHPDVVAALCDHATRLWHLGNGYTNEPVLKVARALNAATVADRAFFCNSGAEADEAAFKLARKYAHEKFGAHKSCIVSCVNAFHGCTLFMVSVGGQPKYTEGFEPLPPHITKVAKVHGVMILIAGPDVLRFLPALIVSDAQIDHAAQLMHAAIDQMQTLSA